MAKASQVSHNAGGMIARRDLITRLQSRSELSPTCFRLELASGQPFAADPGQFGMLACADGLDPLLRRPFSLGGVRPHGGGAVIELLVKEVGKGTALLRRLPLGSELRLLAPLGNAFTLATTSRLALVAGGIGLPPVLFAAERLAALGSAFDLYLGAATAVELLELDRYGRVLACGPTPMLAALTRLAREVGLDAELSLEEPMACGLGVCLSCVVEQADGYRVPTCTHGPVFSTAALAPEWWR